MYALNPASPGHCVMWSLGDMVSVLRKLKELRESILIRFMPFIQLRVGYSHLLLILYAPHFTPFRTLRPGSAEPEF
jgi:hypothetical protein